LSIRNLFCILVLALLPGWVSAQSQGLIALCYHNIAAEWDGDPMTTTRDQFQAQMAWLKAQDYHPISVQQLISARNQHQSLPEKAVLLTFDDGYAGVYEHAFPLLKQFNFPAVLGLVTDWLETSALQQVHYDTGLKPRSDFLTWPQVDQMTASGLLEVASHSHDLHHGISGNPFVDLQPAATTRRYDTTEQSYESDEQFHQRIKSDLQQSSDIVFKHLKLRPRVMVWPFGEFNRETLDIAQSLGFSLSMSLQEGSNNQIDSPVIKRYLVKNNPNLAEFIRDIRNIDVVPPVRVVHVDMDYIYDPDPEQTQRNLGELLDRIKAMHINTVYLQAFSDQNGDGNADAMYFANRHLPMRADLFGHVAWQLITRARVNVYAWMPVLSFPLDAPDDWWVHEFDHDHSAQPILSKHNYRRLSPFHHEARKIVSEIYQDLAKTNHFTGLLFHDDALLTDFEDANPAALPHLKDLTPEQQSGLKIASLAGWTKTMADVVRYYRPDIKTARNLYANVVMDPNSSAWFAQSLPSFLQNYDYTAVMAMPFLENASEPMSWLESLIKKITTYPQGLQKTVFELQAVDWRSKQKVPDATLAEQMSLLRRLDAFNYGYYPDDFHLDKPSLDMLKIQLSLPQNVTDQP